MMPLSIPEIRNIGTVHWRHVESFAAQVEITWDITLDTSEPHKVTAGRGMFTMLALSWGNWSFYCNILQRFYIPLALLKPWWRLHFGRILKLQDIQKRQWKGLIEPKWRTSGQTSSCFCLSAFCELLSKLGLTTFSKENYMMIASRTKISSQYSHKLSSHTIELDPMSIFLRVCLLILYKV